MNDMITPLQRKRLITRRRATEHRRILRIHLTPAGESLLRDCDLRVDSLEKSLFGILAPAEKASFRHLLTTFINSAEPGGAPEREWTEDPTRPAVAAGSRAHASSTSKAPSSPPRTKFLAD